MRPAPGLLPDALRHAAGLVFARPLPAGIEFSLDNSRSSAQWLNQRHSPPAVQQSPMARAAAGGEGGQLSGLPPPRLPGPCTWVCVTCR